MRARADVVSFVAAGILMVSGVWIAWSEKEGGGASLGVRQLFRGERAGWASGGDPLPLREVGLHGEPLRARGEAFASAAATGAGGPTAAVSQGNAAIP